MHRSTRIIVVMTKLKQSLIWFMVYRNWLTFHTLSLVLRFYTNWNCISNVKMWYYLTATLRAIIYMHQCTFFVYPGQLYIMASLNSIPPSSIIFLQHFFIKLIFVFDSFELLANISNLGWQFLLWTWWCTIEKAVFLPPDPSHSASKFAGDQWSFKACMLQS